ncbi:MAG: hypothetical protein KME46_32385 [Brasilonema angustatum HA4187-MV1]|nr:hypothetical protein [Brasilonema angustatum HA4187-MV1]
MQLADYTRLGNWELTFYQRFVAQSGGEFRRSTPAIDPIELPYLTDAHIFLIGVTSISANPSWYKAGWLLQQIDNVKIDDTIIFTNLPRTPVTSVDGKQKLIPLNTIQLVTFPKLTDSYRLRFTPVRWLKDLTLGIWEYRGQETDTTEELIQAIRAKLETIEYKIDHK